MAQIKRAETCIWG